MIIHILLLIYICKVGLVNGAVQKLHAKAEKQTSIVERKAIAHAATPPAATPAPSNSRLLVLFVFHIFKI